MKLCKACGRDLDESCFGKHARNGKVYLRYLCKECMAVRRKEYRSLESTKAAEREYRKRNKFRDAPRISNWARKHKDLLKNRRLVKVYGIDMAWFSSQYSKQGGACAICKCAIDAIPTRYTHVDHDHATGVVRGILCQACNKGLGLFHDSSDALIRASEYLKASRND
jgi:hypothetical protein